MLEQDPADVMVNALIFFINNTANGTHTPYSRSSFTPTTSAVSVNCLFFASLSASIVAALASVVSLQWVAEYDAAVSRSGSSPEDRVKRRQFRYGGMEKWKMREIIASLPVLLYCSLILFFVGLAQWMWSVHTTVGGVVIGGTLLGAAFYTTTTMLAVVFPSCPYRAPIVRWTYALIHFVFRPLTRYEEHPINALASWGSVVQIRGPFEAILYKIYAGTKRAISTITKFIIQLPSKFTKSTVQERDQACIDEEKKKLISDSLSWVAQNISISRDSHHRLLLLAQNSLKLDKDQQLSMKFQEIPWSQIFRLLGSEYVHRANTRQMTEEDENDLAILLGCLRNPRLGQFIAPGDSDEYMGGLSNENTFDASGRNSGEELDYEDTSSSGDMSDVSGDEIKYEKPPSYADLPDLSDDKSPNPTYLLLRNIEWDRRSLSIEEQAKIRIGCLNQAHYITASTHNTQEFHSRLVLEGTTNICDHLIPALCKELEWRAHDDAQDRVDNLICLMHLGQTPLQNVPLMDRETGIVFSQPSKLIYRFMCKDWLQEQVEHPHLHRVLRALSVAQRRNSNLLSLWRFVATEEEVSTILGFVDAEYRPLMSRITHSSREDVRLIEILQTFDYLIAQGCRESQRSVMIELICHDLRLSSSSIYRDYFTPSKKRSLYNLKDPWLRFIGFLAAGMDEQLDHPSMSYLVIPESILRPLSEYILDDKGLINLSSAQRACMRFWHQLHFDETNNLLEKALEDLELLVRV
jgi:hypothetical protein